MFVRFRKAACWKVATVMPRHTTPATTSAMIKARANFAKRLSFCGPSIRFPVWLGQTLTTQRKPTWLVEVWTTRDSNPTGRQN
jgi:hypothetical protein